MPDADGLYCTPITDDDGNIIGTARVSGPLTERDREGIRALIDAVRKRQEEEDVADPEAAAESAGRQRAAIARVRRRAKLDGDVP